MASLVSKTAMSFVLGPHAVSLCQLLEVLLMLRLACGIEQCLGS